MLPLDASSAPTSNSSYIVYGALIGLAGVLVAAVITQALTQFRERAARREAAQREALYDFQDACFNLREALRDYSELGVSPKRQRHVDSADSRVDVQFVRVNDWRTKIKYRSWRKTAEDRFLDGAPFTTEDTAWKSLHYEVGEALGRLERGHGTRRP